MLNNLIYKLFVVLLLNIVCFTSSTKLESKPASDNKLRIIETKNLSTIVEQNVNQEKTILLYVSSPFCPYCKKLEKEIIQPMIKGGQYDDKLILRKFVIDSKMKVSDFNGKERTAKSIMQDFNVSITPTLLFLDAAGNQLHKPIVGYNNDEFFWYYFDQAIEVSSKKLRKASFN